MTRTITNQGNRAYFGDKDYLEVSKHKSFTEMIFELLSEKEPNSYQTQLFNLILNLSIDHGPDTPSATTVIAAKKEGEKIGQSVGEGIAQINEHHGGAIEPLMEVLYQIKTGHGSAKETVMEFLKKGKKLPGFGHRIYKESDPRVEVIFNKAKDLGMAADFIKIVEELHEELNKESGKSLPINIDGAIAAILCSFDWSSKLGTAIFIIARTPGLCGQYLGS